jgi:hypothetical protein
MNLPALKPHTAPEKFIEYGIWDTLPKNYEFIQNFPKYLKGR